ncbi:MAG TPA: acylphosphatase [Ktedonobacterales bacterium]
MFRLRVSVRGMVQGVGYRAFVRRYARQLGITGFARNLGDGSVEVVAEGPAPQMDTFLSAVKRGSPSGYVDSVDVHRETATGEFTAFQIR